MPRDSFSLQAGTRGVRACAGHFTSRGQAGLFSPALAFGRPTYLSLLMADSGPRDLSTSVGDPKVQEVRQRTKRKNGSSEGPPADSPGLPKRARQKQVRVGSRG